MSTAVSHRTKFRSSDFMPILPATKHTKPVHQHLPLLHFTQIQTNYLDIKAHTDTTLVYSLGILDSNGGNTSKGSQMPQHTGRKHQLKPYRNHFFTRHTLTAVLLFTLVTLECLVLYRSSTSPFQLVPRSIYSSSLYQGNEKLGLNQVLERAATPDRTVIVTTLNEAWIEPGSIFDLFLKSFRMGNQTIGLLKHLVVVALDKKAFDYCLSAQDLNCYNLTTEGVDFSGEAHFMTPHYLKMMWRRVDFLRSVLEMGYNFVFTDADIMWLRNPFPHFYSDTDFQISCDAFKGNPSDVKNAPNGGFNYVKSSKQTIEFYKFWYKSRQYYPRKHDQDVLNKIKYHPFIRKIGLEIKFLDTAYFGGFCQPRKDLNLVCTMHANCCAGLDNKIHDLKILLEDWINYHSLPENVRKAQPPSWSVPQHCGPRSFRHHNPRKKNDNKRNKE